MMFRGRGGSPPLAEALRGGRKAVGRGEEKDGLFPACGGIAWR